MFLMFFIAHPNAANVYSTHSAFGIRRSRAKYTPSDGDDNGKRRMRVSSLSAHVHACTLVGT